MYIFFCPVFNLQELIGRTPSDAPSKQTGACIMHMAQQPLHMPDPSSAGPCSPNAASYHRTEHFSTRSVANPATSFKNPSGPKPQRRREEPGSGHPNKESPNNLQKTSSSLCSDFSGLSEDFLTLIGLLGVILPDSSHFSDPSHSRECLQEPLSTALSALSALPATKTMATNGCSLS